MAYNGSGTFSRVFNWATDKGNAVPVTASRMDTEDDGFATGLTNAICKDGQTVTTARIPFVLGASALQGALTGVSYSFSNDVNTGMYSPATDEVALAAGGVQVLDSTATTLTVPIALAVTGASAFTGDSTFAGKVTASATAQAAFFTGFGAMPVGSIIDYAGTAAPAGWLLCFGQSLVRASFPALFTAIGTTFGAADGTHFTLPDCRGRYAAGKDDMGGSAASRITVAGGNFDATVLGGTGGAQNHTLTTGEMPVHTHVVSDPTHLHTVTVSNGSLTPGNNSIQGSSAAGGTSVTDAAQARGTGITNNNAGSGSSHTILSPAIILNKIIFAGV